MNVNPTNGRLFPVKPSDFLLLVANESSSLGSKLSKLNVSSGPYTGGMNGGMAVVWTEGKHMLTHAHTHTTNTHNTHTHTHAHTHTHVHTDSLTPKPLPTHTYCKVVPVNRAEEHMLHNGSVV